MVAIRDPQLHVDPVAENEGRRLASVTYVIEAAPGDRLLEGEFVERVTLRSRDLHDAPVPPKALDDVYERTSTVTEPGVHERRLAWELNRIDLDVGEDWWRSDEGGDPLPIAEILDHITAQIDLVCNDDLLARATTPVITGSWGALGHD